MKMPRMFRITLRELLLVAVIVCLALGWVQDHYRMGSRMRVLVDVAERYESLRMLLMDLDDERWSKINWHGNHLTILTMVGDTLSDTTRSYPPPPSELGITDRL